MVSDDLKVSMLFDNPPSKLPFELWEACFLHRRAAWNWVPHIHFIIQCLPDISDHILGWMWQDVMRRKVDATTMHTRPGTRYSIGLLATINDPTTRWVVQYHRFLSPSGSSIIIKDGGDIAGMQTTISIRLFPAAPKLSDFPAEVWQTGDCHIHDWQNCGIYNGCNYQTYRFIIPRAGAWESLGMVFTDTLHCNFGIHIADGKAKWRDMQIDRSVATCLVRWRSVSRSFFLLVFCIYISSGRPKEALGRWNTYQVAHMSCY